MTSRAPRLIGLSILVAMLASPAYAVDGVVLIDQARAMAGNVTPGDGAGFPITISLPGSYRLSGNLTVPSPMVGIVVTAANVSIDLNGFTMSTEFPQGQLSPSRGIAFSVQSVPSGFALRNGTIEGFLFPVTAFVNVPGVGLLSCRYCSFENLLLRSAFGGTASFNIGSYGRMHNVTAPDLSINVKCPSVVSNTVATSIRDSFSLPGDPDPNQGACTFVGNATLF